MSEITARSVVDQLFHAGRTRAMAQLASRTRAPASRLGLWFPPRAVAASYGVVAAGAAIVYVTLWLVQTWLGGSPGTGAGAFVVALAFGLAAISVVWRGDEGRTVRLRYADLQFAHRCVSGTRVRVRAAASSVPLAAELVGPVDRAYDEVRAVCRTLRLDRNRALRGMAPRGEEFDWDRTILLAHLEVLTAAVIAADEAVAMVSSVPPDLVSLDVPGPRANAAYVATEILEVLAAALDR